MTRSLYDVSDKNRYSESIDFLYSCNTFDTTDADVVAFLPRLLLLHRMNKIQNVQIRLGVSLPPSYPSNFGRPEDLDPEDLGRARKHDHYYRKLWNAIWKNLSEMEGLKTLRVELNMLGYHENLWTAEEFNCVKLVSRPCEIQLVLSDMMARRLIGKVKIGNCTVKNVLADL
jgi:hypothetical protein